MSVVNAIGNLLKPDSENSKTRGETEQTLPSGTPKMTDDYFSAGYQKGFHLTVRFLLSRGLSYELALDTAQAAWTKSWEKREQLRQPALLLTWTNSIALNIYRSLLRRESPNEALPPLEASITLNVAAIDVERILNQCKPNDRTVIENHYIDGYKAREIAQLHGCSETAVRIRLLRARRKIQHQVLNPKGGPFARSITR
jgi:RNA polymerase sigma-70 factor (ECF subfamily)